MEKKNSIKKIVMACLTGIMIISTASCSGEVEPSANLVEQEEENERVVTLFSPMEKRNQMLTMLQETHRKKQSGWQRKSWV